MSRHGTGGEDERGGRREGGAEAGTGEERGGRSAGEGGEHTGGRGPTEGGGGGADERGGGAGGREASNKDERRGEAPAEGERDGWAGRSWCVRRPAKCLAMVSGGAGPPRVKSEWAPTRGDSPQSRRAQVAPYPPS